MANERDKKGRFEKGWRSGPGRGNKKPFKPLDQDEFEEIIAEGLRSRDGKERAVWARVKLTYEREKLNKSDDYEGATIDPVVLDLLRGNVFSMEFELKDEDASSNFGMHRAIRDHLLNCPVSPVRPIFEEVKDDDQADVCILL